MDGSVRGAEDFLKLSKALKAAGDNDLRKKLNKGIRAGVKRHMPVAADALAAALPDPMARKGKAVKQVTKVKTGAATAGVTVAVQYGKAGRGLGASNAQMLNKSGQFRHPVFAKSKWTSLNSGEGALRVHKWVNQSRPAAEGWFDDSWAEAAPVVRRALEQAMKDVAEEIVRRAT